MDPLPDDPVVIENDPVEIGNDPVEIGNDLALLEAARDVVISASESAAQILETYQTALEDWMAALETYATAHPDASVAALDVDATPESLQTQAETIRTQTENARTQTEIARAQLDLLRASQAMVEAKTKANAAETEWDVDSYGPLPDLSEPVDPVQTITDPETGETTTVPVPESEKWSIHVAALRDRQIRMEREQNVEAAKYRLITAPMAAKRERIERARCAGSIDLVGFHAKLVDVFGTDATIQPGNLVNVHATAPETGKTPLHLTTCGCPTLGLEVAEGASEAAKQERLGRINVLLSMGASVNAKDANGNTALHLAVQDACSDPRVTRLLIAHGADPFAVNVDGKTPVELARAFALRELLLSDDGELRHKISTRLDADTAKRMDVFANDAEGAATLFRDVLKRLG